MFKKTTTLAVAAVLVLTVAMATPALAAYIEWDNEGGDGLWSTAANWGGDVADALPTSADKTVIGELNYPSAAENTVTLDIATPELDGFEIYGKGVLNIVDGGILTVAEGGDRGIYVAAAGDVGTQLNLQPGGQLIVENPQDMFNVPAELLTPGGSLVTDTGTMPGYTIYTSTAVVPEPGTMSLLALGVLGLLMLRRRRRA